MSDGIGLVVFDTDHSFCYIYSFHQQRNADQDLLCLLHHQRMVGSQIRLTFYSVDNDDLGFASGRWHQFDLCGECRTTQTDDTGCGDLVYDFFGRKRTLFHERFAAVDRLFPFVTFHINIDSGTFVSACVESVIYLVYFTGYRRVDIRRYKTSGFGEKCTYFNRITLLYHSLGRSPDMLAQRYNNLLGYSQSGDFLPGRQFIFGWMYTSDSKCP